MSKRDSDAILEVLLDFGGRKIREYCLKRLDEGTEPYRIFEDLSMGLEEIGKGYESESSRIYFTSDLIVAGRNMKRAIEVLKPHFKRSLRARGRVVVGTVKGDVHDIGKSIFSIMLESNGFEVIDLGVDVAKEDFVAKIKEFKPEILGMSSLLTSTVSYMGDVVEELKRMNLRDKVKIIIGGRAVTEDFAKRIGVDAYGKDCIDGLRKCLSFIDA
ncbi:cobalamin-dependent protein [Candidatus Bathyarchaeota archaeon]|nr:cobalamin-dependent protein [Candidatus Bathyarchaeota archaeon]MBS7628727.1 cobalamin-dependent protein [Candidatus Bathyarchaeota archaeon]